MPLHNARQLYLSDGVATASPAKLLVLLYERLVRDLVDAEAAINRTDMHAAHSALVHAQDIVLEFRASLDHERWEHAGQLDRIYAFVLERLVEANVSKDAGVVVTCRMIVEPLCDAWRQAAATVMAGGAEAAVGGRA